MTDVLYFGSDACIPLAETYIPSNPYIQKVLFVNQKKLEESMIETDNMTNYQVVMDAIKADRENVLSKEKFYSISCGPKYTILINTEGHIWGFGIGIREKFSEDGISSGKIPIKLAVPHQLRFVNIGCGDNHIIGMTTNQRIYGWGNFGHGRLVVNGDFAVKDPTNIDLSLFTKVMESDFKSQYKKSYYTADGPPVSSNEKLISLEGFACGPENSYFVVNSKLFAAGKGNLGVGATNIISSEYLQETGNTPHIIYSLFRHKIKGVTAGKSHALAWDTEGYIYSWGDPEYGKLGHPVDQETLFEKEILPKRIQSLEHEKVIQAACGNSHSIALTNSGDIYMWGKYTIPEKESTLRETTLSFANVRPKKLDPVKPKSDIKSVVFIKISSGAHHNAALDKDGYIYTWGDSSAGCLGHEKTNDRDVPTPILTLSHKKGIDVACGEKFTTVIVANKDMNIYAKCLEEFTRNSIQTFKERLNMIHQFNTRKKKIRIERKKKELTRSGAEELKIPINKISEKAIEEQITQFYIHKTTDFQKEKLSLISEKDSALKNHGSDPNLDDDDDYNPYQKPRRGATINTATLPPKNVSEMRSSFMRQGSKTSYDQQKGFFQSPKQSIQNAKNAQIVQKNISYVFDAVTEQLNQKSDYYHEFNMQLRKNQTLEEPSQTTTTKFSEKQPQLKTLKQVENELNKKNHVREITFTKLTKQKSLAAHSIRPQTAKNSHQVEMISAKSPLFLQTQESFLNVKTARPISSYSVKHSMLRSPVRMLLEKERDKDELIYDPIKQLEMQRRHEDALLRNSVIIERRIKYIKEIADDRNHRIMLVQNKKEQLQAQRKFKIADNAYKRSAEFKALSEHIRTRKKYIEHFQKQLIAFIGAQYLVDVMRETIERYREQKNKFIQRNLRAAKIQRGWRKHQVIKRMGTLQPQQMMKIRFMIIRYLARRRRQLRAKRVRKVQLLFFYYGLAKKLNQKLLALRNMIIPIQKFIQWSRKVCRLRFRRLALAWDTNVMKLVNSKGDESAAKSSKAESNLNRQKRFIENETNHLGLNKKEGNKVAGDIKTKLEVIFDHMKLRGAMLSLIESEDVQKQQPPQSAGQIQTRGSVEPRSSTFVKNDGVPSFEQITRETLLPFTVHDEELSFTALYSIKKDSSLHEKILPKLIEYENKIKTKILNEIYRDRVRIYRKNLQEYEWRLKDFIIKNRKDIDLERTKTPKETLKAISRKEETEYKLEQSHQANKKRNLNHMMRSERDHLPFAKLKVKIASNMPDAPKLPTFKVNISTEEFKQYWKRYQEEYKSHYAYLVQVSRTKGLKHFSKN